MEKYSGKGKLYIDNCPIGEISEINIENEPVNKFNSHFTDIFKGNNNMSNAGNAFVRFNAVMTKVVAALVKSPGLMRQAALDEVGGYKSRGKGKGMVSYAGASTMAAQKRSAKKARNVKRYKMSKHH